MDTARPSPGARGLAQQVRLDGQSLIVELGISDAAHAIATVGYDFQTDHRLDRVPALVDLWWTEINRGSVSDQDSVRTETVDIFGRNPLNQPAVGMLDIQHRDASGVQIQQHV